MRIKLQHLFSCWKVDVHSICDHVNVSCQFFSYELLIKVLSYVILTRDPYAKLSCKIFLFASDTIFMIYFLFFIFLVLDKDDDAVVGLYPNLTFY